MVKHATNYFTLFVRYTLNIQMIILR